MAKEDQNKTNKWALTGIAIAAIVILVAIVVYAWRTKPAEQVETNNTTTQTEEVSAGKVDELGPNETKLTPDNFDSFIKDNKLVMVDIYSPTCPHCQKIAPVLTEIANENVGKIKIGKMSASINANRDFIVGRYTDFAYVPYILIYKDGKQVESFTGERSKQEFQELVNKYQ